ncbi:lysR family regulatory protein [Seiridium cupressi]
MFGSRAQPPKVPSDTIIPLYFFDNTPLWRAFILCSTLVFDDVLDPQKLRVSLESLIQRDGWRKLSARLRRNVCCVALLQSKNHIDHNQEKGELEYHIPAQFTRERPALSYRHVIHDIMTEQHPIVSRLPRPSSRPAVVADSDDFKAFFRREDGLDKLDDYLYSDVPQLGLNVISFKDKTMVCLDWPHIVMDAMGQRALLDAWSLMLQGRVDEVARPFGGINDDPDPLEKLGAGPTEPYKLANIQLSMFGLAKYAIRNLISFCRAQENRIVCVPAAFLARLHETTLVELAASNNGIKPFLTEGDVLAAWWTRMATSHLKTGPQRSVLISNVYSLRKQLAVDLLPQGRPYVSNAVSFINVHSSLHEVSEQPLGHLALSIRQAIEQLGSRSQIEAYAALWRQSWGRMPPLFGDAGMHMITISNWAQARLFDTNFSASIVPGSGQALGDSKTRGKPSYIQNDQPGMTLPNGFPIIGKDNLGNYWLSGYLPKEIWASVKETLADQ